MDNEVKTIVVNAFGGPGAGKTTCCFDIAGSLKKKGFCVEYASEYAKDLVYDGETKLLGSGTVDSQRKLLIEQNKRIERYIGKADIVVTDSPLILNLMYLKEKYPEYEKEVIDMFNKNVNFNFFVERNTKAFEKRGRVHNLNESMRIDKQIKAFLEEHKIYYGRYYHKTTSVALNNIIKTFNRINTIKEKEITKTHLMNI